MPWYDVLRDRLPSPSGAAPAAELMALTAAAVPAAAPVAQDIRRADRWQGEAWTYHGTLGEFNYGVRWLANMISRVRLKAAVLDPASDEPTVLDAGPAADLVSMFGGGIGGRSEIMRRFTVQLSVPGECYLIGETVDGVQRWQVRSVGEVRAQSGRFQVTDEDTVTTGVTWRDLAKDSMKPIRVWTPSDQVYHLADSPARSALSAMRELELVNRKITAEYLSRLASAGVLAVPSEMDFPVREEFSDADDPWNEEWVELAATSIQTPGTARAAIPMLLKMPADAIDKIKLIDFTLRLDEKVLERRDQAIRRLATMMDIPSDVMLGLGDTNHWTAWAVEESGLKAHIAPLVERICAALTTGFLQPMLAASRVADPGQFVIWYDMSELTLRPDKSASADSAYDRMEIGPDAYRREHGFNEDDKPTPADLEQMGLKSIIRNFGGASAAAYDELIGKQVLVPATVGPGAVDSTKGPVAPPGQPELPVEKAAPPPPAAKPAAPAKAPPAPSAAQVRSEQMKAPHTVRFLADRWALFHPEVCRAHQYSCPYSDAVTTSAPRAVPAVPGAYRVRLGPLGNLLVGEAQPFLDTSGLEMTLLLPSTAKRPEASRA